MKLLPNIKDVREAKRIKQSEVASVLGIDPSNYAKLEKRGEKLTIEQLEAIAGALGVSVVELLTGEPQGGKEDTAWFEERIKELEDRVKDKETLLKQERWWRKETEILVLNFYFDCMQIFANQLGVKHKPRAYGIDYLFIDSISDEDMERIFLEKIAYFPFLWECCRLDIVGDKRFDKVKKIRKFTDDENLLKRDTFLFSHK